MPAWQRYLDAHVQRQRARRDPLGRMPWWVLLLAAVVVLVFAVVQVLGAGRSKLLGLLLLVLVVPSQLLGTYAAWRVQRE